MGFLGKLSKDGKVFIPIIKATEPTFDCQALDWIFRNLNIRGHYRGHLLTHGRME